MGIGIFATEPDKKCLSPNLILVQYKEGMKMKSWRIVCIAALLVIALTASRAIADRDEKMVFTVDVAEDASKFVPGPPIVGGLPQRGSFFITEGKIYPGGTIPGDGSTFDPTDSSGPTPIGRWFCRGTFLVAGDQIPATTEPWVYTSQLYFLPDDKKSIDTSGVEQTAPVVRTVTGGTGKFKGFSGVQKQEFLGAFNTTGGVNLRVTFVLRKAVKDD
jgi:hypothetical protein